jgi:dephospho-CoA kinase
MIVIGVTGGIGSGKSTVGAMLKDLGAAFIDADKVGHRLLREDFSVKQAIHAAFGDAVISATGDIDRRKLASIVFCDPAKLAALNAITHPAISRAVADEVAANRAQGKTVAVVEAPLLVEAGWTGQTDVIWLTVAPTEVIMKRLVGNMGYSESEAYARIGCQTSNDERRRWASVVIDTDLPLDELRQRVEAKWRELKGTSF